jgi:hypothetical protein
MLYSNSLEYYGLSIEESNEMADKVVAFCKMFSDVEDYETNYQPGIKWISAETLKKMQNCLDLEDSISYEKDEYTYILILNMLRFSLFWHNEDDLEVMRSKLVKDLSMEQH